MDIRYLVALAMLLSATGAQAQEATSPTIAVSGYGTVETPPDIATLLFVVRGEGATPDAATGALAATQKRVIAGLRSLDPTGEVRTGTMQLAQARDSTCTNNGYNDELDARRLATGACAVTGYVVRLETTVMLHSPKLAGTLVGLAGRLGAGNARIEGFGLSPSALTAARQRAVTVAYADGLERARRIATAAGTTLGPVVSVSDGNRETVVTTSFRKRAITSEDIGAFAPPIAVDIEPRPVATNVALGMSFALKP